MAIERVRQHLRQWNMEHLIQEFSVSSATVLEAAEALGIHAQRIAKTLAFRHEEGTLLVVTAGDAKVDNQKFRAAFNMKARMLSPEETLEQVGHAVGGVCPFGVNEGCQVVLDVSLQRFETIFPACGSSNSAIELSCDALMKIAQSTQWVDVCKDWI